MANYPNIHNLRLCSCCIRTIEGINNRLKLGNILSIALGPAVFTNIFGPSPSTLNTIVAVSQMDFVTLRTLVQANASIQMLARQAALSDCQSEWVHHIGQNKLELFWRGMMDVFSG